MVDRQQNTLTFGKVIASARKAKGLYLKECAPLIQKENGQPISFQYLNDIERGHRQPTSDRLINQFAEVLDIPRDLLYYLAGKLPPDINNTATENQIIEAWKAFRETLAQRIV